MNEFGHDPSPPQAPSSTRELGPTEVGQFQEWVDAKLSDLNNLLVATPEQSLRAMAVASVATDALIDALSADPEAFDVVGQFRGPLQNMSDSAGRMHQHQTGHSFPDAYYKGINPDYETGMSALQGIKFKVNDRRWDATRGPSSNADASTAHSRKGIAKDAAAGLAKIVEVRGGVTIREETFAQILADSQQ